MNIRKLSSALLVATLLGGATSVLAQGGAAPPQGSQALSTVAQGQLVRVDPDAKTLAIRTAQGSQMSFRYTDQTKVTGASDSVAGLATMTGAQLSVRYTQEGKENIAAEIVIQQQK